MLWREGGAMEAGWHSEGTQSGRPGRQLIKQPGKELFFRRER